MKCINCGTENQPSAALCRSCGSKLASPKPKRMSCFSLGAAVLVILLAVVSILILFGELAAVSSSKAHLVDLVQRVQKQVFTQSVFLSVVLVFSLVSMAPKKQHRLVYLTPLLAMLTMGAAVLTLVEGPLYGGGYFVLFFVYALMLAGSLVIADSGYFLR